MKHVLITGGSSGIGKAAVEQFAESGYKVSFTYNRGKGRAEELAASLKNRDINHYHLDQSSAGSVKKLADELDAPVDILINNAGLGTATVKNVSSDPYEQDRALIHVNATGALWVVRAFLPEMRRRGYGKIINVSSVGGGVGVFPGFSLADGMSKAAMAFMGRQLAAETVHEPVDVFTICPGATETPMFSSSSLENLTDEQRKALINKLPKKRLIEPSEIASLMLFLCSDAGRVLHGAILDASLGLGVHPGTITGN